MDKTGIEVQLEKKYVKRHNRETLFLFQIFSIESVVPHRISHSNIPEAFLSTIGVFIK